MSDPDDYTVGWICATATEFTAACAFFDEEHKDAAYVRPGDDNSYVLGRIGKHNVVMTALPDGEYGLTAAGTAAKDMMHSFPNVRIGLSVGIGGGAPNMKNDIRLGDIVVSSPCDGHGGVFQYDYGRTVQRRSFQATRFLNQPPTILRTAVTKLKANYEKNGHSLAGDAEKAIRRIKKWKKYTRPPAESDRLYQSDVVHPPDSTESCKTPAKRKSPAIMSNLAVKTDHVITCSHDNLEALLVPRNPRGEEGDEPRVHYGLIASANQLMNDAHGRDRLSAEKGVLCFETEAAGLMNTFPCLAIRGICGYADSHTNNDWHGYAAVMAAAYAKDLLRQIPPSKVGVKKMIVDVVGIEKRLEKFRQPTSDKHEDVGNTRQDTHNQTINGWFGHPDPTTNASSARKLRHEGTNAGFLQSPDHQEWQLGQPKHT